MDRWLAPWILLAQVGFTLAATDLPVQDLINPILRSAEEIDARADYCRSVLARSPARDPLQVSLARLYLTFAKPDPGRGGVEAGRLRLIELGRYEDSALRLLRQRVGLPAPPGYVFVRTYSSRHVMPSDVLPAFQRPDTQAVTFFGRYIAMLAPKPAHPGEQGLYDRAYGRVLSHELVHAFIGSTVTWRSASGNLQQEGGLSNNLPRWFHEGCATYLSDSPGGGCLTGWVETPVGYRLQSLQSRAPEDYRDYKLAFDYAESRLGRQGLYDLIGQTIRQEDVGILLTRLGLTSFFDLLEQAGNWRRRRLYLGYGLATALVLALAFSVWRLLPGAATAEAGPEQVPGSPHP